MAFGFKAVGDNGETIIDGELPGLNLVYSTVWTSPSLGYGAEPPNAEAGDVYMTYITAVPAQFLSDQHVFVVRCLTAYVAAYRVWNPFGTGLQLQMYVHPTAPSFSTSTHDVEIYVFKSQVAAEGDFGLKVFSSAGTLMFSSEDKPLRVVSGEVEADEDFTIPSGVGKAAVFAVCLNSLNGGDYGDGYIYAPMTMKVTATSVKSSKMLHLGSPWPGVYMVVDVSNCPIPFSV